MLSRVPQQDAPLAYAIIAQAQAENKKNTKPLQQFPKEYKQHIHHEQLFIYFKNKLLFP